MDILFVSIYSFYILLYIGYRFVYTKIWRADMSNGNIALVVVTFFYYIFVATTLESAFNYLNEQDANIWIVALIITGLSWLTTWIFKGERKKE